MTMNVVFSTLTLIPVAFSNSGISLITYSESGTVSSRMVMDFSLAACTLVTSDSAMAKTSAIVSARTRMAFDFIFVPS